MPAPRFDLPDALKRLFRGGTPRTRGTWGRWSAAVRDVTARHRVLPLVVDAEGLLALDVDGRVVAVRWTSGAAPEPIGDLRTRDLAVLRAVARYRELAVLVPRREHGDIECRCRGVAAFEPTLPAVVCFCGGLGFLPSRWREEDDDAGVHAPSPPSTGAATAAVAVATRPRVHAMQALSTRRPAAPGALRPSTGLAVQRAEDAGRARRIAVAVLLGLLCALAFGWAASI